MKTQKKHLFASKGSVAALIATAATVPLAPLLVLIALAFLNPDELRWLANPGCVFLGWLIALPIALTLSFVVLTPLAYFCKKMIAGPRFKWLLSTLLAATVTGFTGFMLVAQWVKEAPALNSFGIAVWVSGLICVLLGITVYALHFRKDLLKEKKYQAFEPKLPPIPARTEGIYRNCRIGKRKLPVGYKFPHATSTLKTNHHAL